LEFYRAAIRYLKNKNINLGVPPCRCAQQCAPTRGRPSLRSRPSASGCHGAMPLARLRPGSTALQHGLRSGLTRGNGNIFCQDPYLRQRNSQLSNKLTLIYQAYNDCGLSLCQAPGRTGGCAGAQCCLTTARRALVAGSPRPWPRPEGRPPPSSAGRPSLLFRFETDCTSLSKYLFTI
jgi:hypothetical protein